MTEPTELSVKERPILFSAPMVRALLDGRKTMTRRIVKPIPPEGWIPECVEFYRPEIEDDRGMLDAGPEIFGAYNEDWGVQCPCGGPGERLWVRESFDIVDDAAAYHIGDGPRPAAIEGMQYQCKDATRRGPNGERWVVDYAADVNSRMMDKTGDRKWKPSIHMPRWASRITLEITSVRVERLNEISEEDAIAEGIERSAWGNWKCYGKSPCEDWLCPVNSYMSLWNSIDGKAGPHSWDMNPWVWVIEFRKV